MDIHPLAGTLPPASLLIDVPKLVAAYYTNIPDPDVPAQRVTFGTSGHRGSAFSSSFNEWHIVAIAQAICAWRREHGIDGPLFLGRDTHALSYPALLSCLEVLTANGVEVMVAAHDAYTPTPVISHAILTYNAGKTAHLADGIVITPSHNPPHEGGIKYNPPNGGPAEVAITRWIESRANELIRSRLNGVQRLPYAQARISPTVHEHDYIATYTKDLVNVIDMAAIRQSKIKLGVDPLGGAGVQYWGHIAEVYGLNLTVTNTVVDPTFRFMTLDWDGNIRMDPSSAYAMRGLIGLKDQFDVAFACDTDHDRHGIVTRHAGLLPPNHFLTACIWYLFHHRPAWAPETKVGTTVVSSRTIERVTKKVGRALYDVPVGFKWFVEGLCTGALVFAGEESAGATFARHDGSVWTTDKDGIIASLLAAEMTAKTGKDPGEWYALLAKELGAPVYERCEAPATREQKERLAHIRAEEVQAKTLAGEPILSVLTHAPANDAPIGGVKVIAENGWFAARPSGTEDIYKIYVESFLGEAHLRRILDEAQQIVTAAMR